VRIVRILLDVDGCIAALVEELCAHLRDLGYRRQPEDIVHYEIRKCVTAAEASAVSEKMREIGFCVSLPWYYGAREFVDKLHALGEVIVVTKPNLDAPTWVYEREQWLASHVNKIVHTAHKELVAGDVLIEDSIENAHKWLSAHPGKLVILLDRPWNRSAGLHIGVRRALAFEEALEFVEAALYQDEPTSPELGDDGR
jgi:5'(3')-deoxyribonucleotidase